jgi:hypothetical protein
MIWKDLNGIIDIHPLVKVASSAKKIGYHIGMTGEVFQFKIIVF